MKSFLVLQIAMFALVFASGTSVWAQDPPIPSTVKGNSSGQSQATGKEAVAPKAPPVTRRDLNAGRNRRNRNGNANRNAKPRKEVEVKFGADPGKPVLEVDIVGGFRMKHADDFKETPVLQIFSDGRIVTGRKSPLVKEVEGQMDLVELKSLLSFIADDCRFFDLSTDSVKKDMTSDSGMQMMDAGTTRFSVNLNKHSNDVEVYALPQVAGKFSDVPSVASMIAIASRCRRLVALTRIGSEEEAEVALAQVNKKLAKELPKQPEFELNDLQFAEQFADGRRSATFVKVSEIEGAKIKTFATWQQNASGSASVSVNSVKQ